MVQKNGDHAWRTLRTLPKAERETGNDIVWRRGCTSLLAVNKQIHEEACDMLYGDNVFVVDIAFNAIMFRYRWRTANNLTPNRNMRLMEQFSWKNLLRIKKYVINVENADDYTGMVKYNVGGRGLPVGVERKVQELVELMKMVDELHRVELHLVDGQASRRREPDGKIYRVLSEDSPGLYQSMLGPFEQLKGVRKAKVTGVTEKCKTHLETMMTRPTRA